MPPEADPVIPARTFTDMASDTRGLPTAISMMPDLMVSNADSEAMTAPNPTRLAVLKMGRTEASAPASRLSRRAENLFMFSAVSTAIEMTRAEMIDQTLLPESMSVSP